MSVESDLLNRIVSVVDRIEQRISNAESEIRRLRTASAQTFVTEMQTQVTESTATQVRTVPYTGHLFQKAPNKLKATTQTFYLPHYADHIIVMGTVDYQVEFDQTVSPQTPVSSAFSTQSYSMKVLRSISYVIPQEFINTYGDGVTGDMYVWLLWF